MAVVLNSNDIFVRGIHALHTIRSSLALWGLASTPALAQSITSGPASLPVPVDNPLLLALLAAALVLGAFAALRKHRVLAALLPATAATLLVWQSPELRAQLLRAFVNPAGETLPIPVQQLPGGPPSPGFEPVDFRNDSGVHLRIRDVELPTLGQCFPAGLSDGLLPPASSFDSSVACAKGLELAPGAACRVDVDAHCRDLSGVRCYDHSVFPLFDVYYTGVPNDPTNLPRFFSDNGTCTNALGPFSEYYVVVANSLAEADTLCPLTNVYTMAGWGFIGAPANLYICTSLTQP